VVEWYPLHRDRGQKLNYPKELSIVAIGYNGTPMERGGIMETIVSLVN